MKEMFVVIIYEHLDFFFGKCYIKYRKPKEDSIMKKLIAIILAALMLCSFAACGTTTNNTVYTIGICQYSEHESLALATKGFMDALVEEFGTENVIFDIQNAFDHPEICTDLINRFVSRNVNLIMANATPALQEAARATVDIPIVGTSVTDYATALEIENFDGIVGKNITGTSDMVSPQEQAKVILEFVPDAKKVAMLCCTSEENSIYQVNALKKELEAKGVTCVEVNFTDTNDIADAVRQAIKDCDALYIPTDNKAASAAEVIDGICRPAGVPVFAADEGTYSACGIATLSASYYHLGYRTGEMAIEILKGKADISTMPIVHAEELALKYNKELCDELGITVPEAYLKTEG